MNYGRELKLAIDTIKRIKNMANSKQVEAADWVFGKSCVPRLAANNLEERKQKDERPKASHPFRHLT